jgi:hypothetical protein
VRGKEGAPDWNAGSQGAARLLRCAPALRVTPSSLRAQAKPWKRNKKFRFRSETQALKSGTFYFALTPETRSTASLLSRTSASPARQRPIWRHVLLCRDRSGSGLGRKPALQPDLSHNSLIFKATVFTPDSIKGFVGYGDADPSNVSSLVHGAEMRVAETRAVNRALRKASGIGICSVEEIGSAPQPAQSQRQANKLPPQPTNGNGGPKVRDSLCQIIRQHQLDPNLVKSYAVDFCGTKTLREATREQVENFVAHLTDMGRERPQCPALPAQQLFVTERRCGMRRYFESLRPADRSAIESVPDEIFLVRVDRAQ